MSKENFLVTVSFYMETEKEAEDAKYDLLKYTERVFKPKYIHTEVIDFS